MNIHNLLIVAYSYYFRLRSLLKNKGSEIFFLHFLWWSMGRMIVTYLVDVFLIVADILGNETLGLNVCFIPISPTLGNFHPLF